MRRSSIYRRLTLFASTIALTLLAGPVLGQQHESIDRVVAFGGSLSDTGNAFIYLSKPENRRCGLPQNVPPYDALDDLLIPDGPYAKGGHHFSNGATWVEGLARYLALSGNARPALRNDGTQASNYAAGGARARPDYDCRFNLPDQVSAYLTDFPLTSAKTLLTIEMGGNDVRDALATANPALIGQALASLGNNIGLLYARGARKFLVLNVPDIGKSPAVIMLDAQFPGAAVAANQLSQGFNGGLAGLVSLLSSQLPGIDIKVLDLYKLLNDVVADPAAYGFTDVTHACVTPNVPPFKCAAPDSYVFWDGTHPTQAMHAVIAQQAIAKISAP